MFRYSYVDGPRKQAINYNVDYFVSFFDPTTRWIILLVGMNNTFMRVALNEYVDHIRVDCEKDMFFISHVHRNDKFNESFGLT